MKKKTFILLTNNIYFNLLSTDECENNMNNSKIESKVHEEDHQNTGEYNQVLNQQIFSTMNRDLPLPTMKPGQIDTYYDSPISTLDVPGSTLTSRFNKYQCSASSELGRSSHYSSYQAHPSTSHQGAQGPSPFVISTPMTYSWSTGRSSNNLLVSCALNLMF